MKTFGKMGLLGAGLLLFSCEESGRELGKAVGSFAGAFASEVSKPVQKSTEESLARIQEQQRIREQQAAEEKARLDALPNGPRRK